jgi:predicted ATPase
LLANVTLEPETNLLSALRRLVQSELVFQRGSRPNAVYTFKHALVQDAAYNSLLRNTRRELHARIAQAWSDAGGAEPEVLAYHFSEAGMIEAAIDYWSRAGRRAADRSSNVEAISHFGMAIDLLDQLPDTQQKARQELILRASLGVPLSATQGPGAKETFDNYERARELCLQFPDAPEHFQVLWGFCRMNIAIGRLAEASDMASELMMLAKRSGSIDLLLEGHHAQWTTLSRFFEPLQCWHHTEQGIALYEADKHHRHSVTISDHDAGVCGRCFGALSLWQLGQADRALVMSEDAVNLARRMSHPASLAHALTHSAWQLQLQRDLDRVCRRFDEIKAFAEEHRFPQFVATASILKGWALCKMGQHEAGLPLIRRAMASGQAKGTGQSNAYFLHLLADGLLQARQPEEGLRVIRQAVDEMELNSVRAFEPEINRIRAELLKCCDKVGSEEVETVFQKAIGLSHEKGAIALELRAAMGLARHWRGLGKAREAHEFLKKIYDRFTEGFDTPDLMEARQLLKELA